MASSKYFNERELKKIEKIAGYLSTDQIADYFGIAQSTFYEIMKRQKEASEAYKRGKAQAIEAVATSLITKARKGDTAAAIFYLKTRAGWRETTPDPDNRDEAPPVTINIMAKNARKD